MKHLKLFENFDSNPEPNSAVSPITVETTFDKIWSTIDINEYGVVFTDGFILYNGRPEEEIKKEISAELKKEIDHVLGDITVQKVKGKSIGYYLDFHAKFVKWDDDKYSKMIDDIIDVIRKVYDKHGYEENYDDVIKQQELVYNKIYKKKN